LGWRRLSGGERCPFFHRSGWRGRSGFHRTRFLHDR